MSFETGPAKKPKFHSPTLAGVMIRQSHSCVHILPAKNINWSEAVRTIGIPNKNGGQVLKEFAKGKGFDVLALECLTSPPPTRKRRQKKLLGREFSTPALPTPKTISDEQQALVASGKLSISEPCSPYLLTKCIVTNDGEVVTNQVELHRRKIPLYELHQKLLIQQENYMKLMTMRLKFYQKKKY